MSDKTELLDLRVYGKGMSTHIVAKSELIGKFIEDNAAKQYEEIVRVSCPLTYISHFTGDKVQLTYLTVNDGRHTGLGNPQYGYTACSQRGNGFLNRLNISYDGPGISNNSLFVTRGLREGVHLVIPRMAGQDTIEAYVKDMRAEAEYIFKTWLKPTERRVRIYVEDYRYE